MPTRKMLSKAVQFWWMHPENWHVDVDIAIRSLWRFEPSIYIVDTFFQVSSLCISRTYKLYQDHMIPLSNFGILLQAYFYFSLKALQIHMCTQPVTTNRSNA